jgi:hypothetical protein
MGIRNVSKSKKTDEQNRLQEICEKMIANEEETQTEGNVAEDCPPEQHEAEDCGTLNLDDCELMILLKYWLKEVLDIIGEIGKGTADSNTYCAGCGAVMRIIDILNLEVICQHKFEIVIREVNDELGINLSSDWWYWFLQSDEANEWIQISVDLPH